MRPALLGSRVPRGLRRAVWSLVCLVAAAALVAPAAAAAGASLWVGLEGSGFLGAELDGLLGPVTLVVQSRNGQEPRSTPQEKFLSATPIAAAETVLGAFYTVDLGPVSVGVGGVHLRRERTGMVREADLALADPSAGGQAGAQGQNGSTPSEFPYSFLSETSTGLAAQLRLAAASGPWRGETSALITSEGTFWAVQAGWAMDPAVGSLYLGIGYRAGTADGWWNGPFVAVGAGW